MKHFEHPLKHKPSELLWRMMLAFSVFLFVCGLVLSPWDTLLPGLAAIHRSPDVLISDYFVIGGMGSGIPVYRQLQRRGIPFTAGVLQENDVDYPVAKALAVEVIGERSFEPIGESAFARAAARMKTCGKVLCCLREFGAMNGKNRELMELAKKAGTLTDSL